MDTNPFDNGTLNFQLFALAPGESFTWSRRVDSTEPVKSINTTKLALKRFVQGRLNIFHRGTQGIRYFFKMEQGFIHARDGGILVIVVLTKK